MTLRLGLAPILAAAALAPIPALAAPPLPPATPTALQTALKDQGEATFRFRAQGLPYSQIGSIDYACTKGGQDPQPRVGSFGYEASTAPNTPFGINIPLATTTSLDGGTVVVNVRNNRAGYYCLVRVWSPDAEIP